ncbi:hypothetical protein M6B22_21745 [Jatrophihabitans cynanchi]|jgi:hypothetical protein|uniref:Type 4 fimbrial biogenesis protein PilX N-terminal domain-containing protein n=1 Tax=Jatrophihabitans cynanchi TaxID=2944128 RepID=A0ABY7JX21_9ACTN|nr:hypothetical protein [Jatrophihabitans sp. SB3-54]WAX57114.1 hypothetical protein M6B22_21745 [Jatrophihabitans sp. SB3-54]
MTRRARPSGDGGVTLILALIIITTIALVIGATLSLATTNVKATVALRDQAATSYSADGAAQVAVNQLRTGTFPGANCTATATQSLLGFFPATSTVAAGNAAVQCIPDPGNTSNGGGSNSSPGSAILTLSDGTGGERGIYVNTSNNASVKVNGGIFSDSTIFLEGNKSDLQNTNTTNSYVYAMGNCSSSGTSRIISTPAPVCNYSTNPLSAVDRRGKDPGTITGHGSSFDAPAAPTANGTVAPASCSAKTAFEFLPGLYRSAAALNALTNGAGACSGSVWHFNPGTYYFDFTDPGVHQWIVSSGFLVGGTANVSGALTVAKIQNLQNAGQPYCIAPTVGGTTLNGGVRFVFGGDSRMYVTKGLASANPNVQICASNSPSGPPIAIYGLKSGIGSGAFAVAAESGCITNTGYVAQGGDATHCAVVQTTNDPNPALTVYGTTYVPRAVIDLYLNNNTVQVFRWGLVTRALLVGSTGSTNLANAVIDVPNDAPAPFAVPSVLYLNVFVCTGPSACSTAGTPKLRAKVQLSTTTPTTATVLSWSQQR